MRLEEELFSLDIIFLVNIFIFIIYVSIVDLQKIYDAYTHMFLATHYLKFWGEVFDPRWYLGFNITSYLPFYHESLALFSIILGLENAYRISSLVILLLLIYGLYGYYNLFFPSKISHLSTYLIPTISSTYIFFLLFGQLPQLLSISLTLISIYYMDRYIRNEDSHRNIYLCISILTLSSALITHSLTIFIYSILFTGYLVPNLKDSIFRSNIKFILLIWVISLLISSPILYLHINSIYPQLEIPHGSRYPFKTLNNFLFFFIDVYSLLIILFPLSIYGLIKKKNLSYKEAWYTLILIFFFLIGLGKTTPIPDIIFGGWSNWLTYDRFSLMASLLSLPLITKYLISVDRKYLYLTIIILLSTSIISTEYSRYAIFPSQDVNVDIAANILDKGEYKGYTYLTLGFGVPSLAKLSIYTDLPTIDGAYPTARSHMKILSESGIETIDSAKLYSNGMNVLENILANKRKYGIYLILCADDFYNPILFEYGYHPSEVISQGRKFTVWISDSKINKIIVHSRYLNNLYIVYYWYIIPIILMLLIIFSLIKLSSDVIKNSV